MISTSYASFVPRAPFFAGPVSLFVLTCYSTLHLVRSLFGHVCSFLFSSHVYLASCALCVACVPRLMGALSCMRTSPRGRSVLHVMHLLLAYLLQFFSRDPLIYLKRFATAHSFLTLPSCYTSTAVSHNHPAFPMSRHTGSIFLGQWTPESVGDYASGTNHVLPTYGYSRMYR